MALRFKCAEVSVIDNNLFQDRLDGHVHLVLTLTLKKKSLDFVTSQSFHVCFRGDNRVTDRKRGVLPFCTHRHLLTVSS